MPNETDSEKAAKAIKSLLEHLEVKHVVSVDDEYAADADTIFDLVLRYPESAESVEELRGQDFTKPTDVVRSEVKQRLAALKSVQLEEANRRLRTKAGVANEDDVGLLGPLIRGSSVKYEELSLKGWKAKYAD